MIFRGTLISFFLTAIAASIDNENKSVFLDLSKSWCENKRPYHTDIDYRKVLLFNKNMDETLYKCHQEL